MTKLSVAVDTSLLALIEQREHELAEAREENSRLRDEVRRAVDWMYQTRSMDDEDGLPVPRVQLTLMSNEYSQQHWMVSLVRKEWDGCIARIPLSSSRVSGAPFVIGDIFRQAVPGQSVNNLVLNRMPRLVNELCFAHEELRLDAYVVVEDHHMKLTAARPQISLELLADADLVKEEASTVAK